MIAQSEQNLSESHSGKLIDDEEVKALVTEMHEMIHKILQNQKLKDNIPEEKKTSANLDIYRSASGTEDYTDVKKQEHEGKDNSYPAVVFERTNPALHTDQVESSSEETFVHKLAELIATIERITRNPVWMEHQQTFSPSPTFDPNIY